MLLGTIWAQAAWGRWWGWDLKEVWTLITWLVFSLYAHVRRRSGWEGRRLAWLTLAGFASVLFTFLGVGWLARAVGLESLHLFGAETPLEGAVPATRALTAGGTAGACSLART